MQVVLQQQFAWDTDQACLQQLVAAAKDRLGNTPSWSWDAHLQEVDKNLGEWETLLESEDLDEGWEVTSGHGGGLPEEEDGAEEDPFPLNLYHL